MPLPISWTSNEPKYRAIIDRAVAAVAELWGLIPIEKRAEASEPVRTLQSVIHTKATDLIAALTEGPVREL